MTEKDSISTSKAIVNGKNIFYRYRPGTSDIYISFLHGYPTSSLDYSHLIEKIPNEFHVLAHDHLGFGYSDKPISYEYLLSQQADFACGLYDVLGIQNIHIVAHDYGTSVATEIIAKENEGRNNFNLISVTLCNGSILIEMAKLRLIQRLLKSKWLGGLVAQLSSSITFHRNMKNIWYDKSLYRKDEMNAHWELLIRNNGRKVLPQITRYIDQRYIYYNRWVDGLKNSTLPFHILWAQDDPVAIVDMAFKLESIIQSSSLTIIEQCGHYPMMEKEDEWLHHTIHYIQGL